jgi:hypothetical protein
MKVSRQRPVRPAGKITLDVRVMRSKCELKGRGLFRMRCGEETLMRLNHSYLATSTFSTLDRYRSAALVSRSRWLANILLIRPVARP